MFENLGDLGFARSPKQAIGRYLSYLIGFLVVAFLIGVIYSSVVGVGMDPEVLRFQAFRLGIVLGVVVAGVLGYLILRAKGLLNNLGFVALVLLAMGVAYLGGSVLSFMILAYLTTRPALSLE